MTNDNSVSGPNSATHTAPTHTDLTNNSSPISDPTGSGLAGGNAGNPMTPENSGGASPLDGDTLTSDPMAQPLPPAQDAGQNVSAAPDLHTGIATEPLPLTSSTGTGFNAPDAGTGVPDNSGSAAGGTATTTAAQAGGDAPLPGVGNIDRDALAGEMKGAGSQANAEAISSTGPV